MKKINVVVVGLAFGGAFVEIYKHHPDVESVGICDTDAARLREVGASCGVARQYASYDAVIADQTVDAVHIVTPFTLHEEQTVQALRAGKHCASTVPMAMSLAGIQRVVDAVRQTGKRYMMMETTLYTYQFFYVQALIASGALGRIQFMRGSHYQDMANWPDYWMGLPPMYYGTHAIGPMVALSGSRVSRVHCFGSGTMDEALAARYNNPFPVESALFAFENGMKGEATRSLFETARTYQEGLFVYGSKACFEWGFKDRDLPYLTLGIPAEEGSRGGTASIEIVDLPNYHHRLPEAIQRFTVGGNFDPLNPQDSLKKGAGAGHHGSHVHLVHEFVRSVVEDRRPAIDEVMGANISAAGICAHDSAMQDGASVTVPVF